MVMICAWNSFDSPEGMSFFVNQCEILNKHERCWILDVAFGSGLRFKKRRKQGIVIVSIGLPGRLRSIIVNREKRLDLGSVLVAGLLNLLKQPVIIQSVLLQEGVVNQLKVPAVIIEHYSGFEKSTTYPAVKPHIPVCAVSPGLAAAISRQLGRSVTVVGNPIPSVFTMHPSDSVLKSDGVRMILFAKNIPVKNLNQALKAVSEVVPKHEGWKFTIVSDSLPTEENCSEVVEFLPLYGKLSAEQVRHMMLESDVVCSFSRTETFGLTIAEALSLARPVLATPTSGGKFLICNGVNGFLAQGFQRHHIAEVLKKAERAKCLSGEAILESVAHLKEGRWANNVLNSFQKPRGKQP